MKKILAKNKFLKIASLLVVVFLITTCVIGTTFAKYTTSSSGNDSAKIAKWGIEVSASGSLFGKNYGNTIVASNASDITVKAETNADYNVVAPGTKNDTGFQVKISGTPEVNYEMTSKAEEVKDIFLSAGTYGMMVEKYGLNAASDVKGLYTYNTTSKVYTKCTTSTWTEGTTYYTLQDSVEIDGTYYPIQWKLNGTDYDTLEEALAVITTATNGTKVAVVDSADAEYTLTWSWAYEQTDKENKLDTVLGNLAAGKTNVVKRDTKTSALDEEKYKSVIDFNSDDYSLEVGFKYNITINQVD